MSEQINTVTSIAVSAVIVWIQTAAYIWCSFVHSEHDALFVLKPFFHRKCHICLMPTYVHHSINTIM